MTPRKPRLTQTHVVDGDDQVLEVGGHCGLYIDMPPDDSAPMRGDWVATEAGSVCGEQVAAELLNETTAPKETPMTMNPENAALEAVDALITEAAATAGAEFGMTAEQYVTHLAIGEVPHPNAPATDCGATDPRDDAKWCLLGPDHRGEGHNCYAPPAPYRTWTEWQRNQGGAG